MACSRLDGLIFTPSQTGVDDRGCTPKTDPFVLCITIGRAFQWLLREHAMYCELSVST